MNDSVGVTVSLHVDGLTCCTGTLACSDVGSQSDGRGGGTTFVVDVGDELKFAI
jgi:hypothetical protein